MKAATAVALLATVAGATLVFYLVVHQVSAVWLDVALRPEVREALVQSMEDQKKLRDADPAHREEYRRRFEASRQLLSRIDVIRMSREAMLRRFEIALVGVFAVALTAAVIVWWMRQRRAEAQRREEFAKRFTSWQEAARRHAHEIRTPLTAARLEVDRLASLMRADAPREEVERATESVFEELDRLARFTREFSSFAAMPQPVLEPQPLDRIIVELCETFAGAWPQLTLRFEPPSFTPTVAADRDMLRQVLVNLCTNSSRAGADRVTFTIAREGDRVHLDVADNGHGIPEPIRARIFDPYVTTRKIGEGMGLGLAISRKIMVDHGGDLRLLASGAGGTTFRVTLEKAQT